MQFDWTDQRQAIFLDRYALRRNGELIETNPSQMQERVASTIAHNESERQEFLDILTDFRFVPGGRILSGAGSDQHSVTFYNCFVLGLHPTDPRRGRDSRDSILSTISKMIEILCRGGGVGINWSILRPDRAQVRGVQGESTGPIGWMRGADALADQVRQGGSRTAALMFMLDDWHPDILSFIAGERFKRANSSVAISDDFMRDLRSSHDWVLRFPRTSDPEYDILWDGDIYKWESLRYTNEYKMPASKLWKEICKAAVRCGNPGVVFIDRCKESSISGERLVCANPCGEQPLPEYGSCNLGSINLVALCDSNGDIDKGALKTAVWSAVKFLDNVIDKTPPLYYEIDSKQRLFRRIGLGTMGLADVMILNKVRYGSEESLDLIREIFSLIRDEAFLASRNLAESRGIAPMFSSVFEQSKFARSLRSDVLRVCSKGIRNMSVLTQAPTGTTSILAGVSSGIEPIFSAEYTRKDNTGEYQVRHPLFDGQSGEHLVTAHMISPEEHVKVQAELQRFVDSGISKTVNLPPSATEADVDKIFRMAYDLGCKGITIYRSESLNDEVLSCKTCNV